MSAQKKIPLKSDIKGIEKEIDKVLFVMIALYALPGGINSGWLKIDVKYPKNDDNLIGL